MSWLNGDAAFRGFAQYLLNKGARIEMVGIPNNGRHKLIKSSFGYFYCVYKKQMIHSFSTDKCSQKYLKAFPKDLGYGESINVDALQYALKFGYPVLIYLYPNEAIYAVQAKKVRDLCTEWGMSRLRLKEELQKEITSDGRLLNVVVNENEYWFPVVWLTNFKGLYEVK